jgi:hypothetical protein
MHSLVVSFTEGPFSRQEAFAFASPHSLKQSKIYVHVVSVHFQVIVI